MGEIFFFLPPCFFFLKSYFGGPNGLREQIWQPITQTHFQNIFDSGNSGSFKARMLTILLRILKYDYLNTRKRIPWDDQREQEASLLKSSAFHFVFYLLRPQTGWWMYYLRKVLSFWVETYETPGQFIILKIAKVKIRTLEYLRLMSSGYVHWSVKCIIF